MPQLDIKRLHAGQPMKTDDAIATRPYLEISQGRWLSIVTFLLSMAAYGLEFLPALIVVFFLMIRSFVNDRHEFLVQLTLFSGAYGLYFSDPLIIRNDHLIFIVVLLLAIIYRKPPIVKQTFGIIGLYFLAFIILASFSDFSVGSQLMKMRHCFYFIYFLVPVVAFSSQEFDFSRFMEWILGYTIALSGFYILDSFVICGHVFVPRVFDYDTAVSTWTDLHIHLFSSPFRRIYPPGLYIATIAIYGIARTFRLHKWQYAVFMLGVACTKTITFIVGLLISLSYLRNILKHIAKYSLLLIASLVALYFIDGWVEEKLNIEARDFESPLRIKSTVDQIADLINADTIDDYAKFGSGRMAQAIPKFELMYKYGKEWTGMGFLDRVTTTNTRYIIDNDFVGNPDDKVEVATGVEIAYAQTILNVGYIGLVVQLLIYIMIAFRVRKLHHFKFFMSVFISIMIFGINGICSINNMDGLLLLALSYGVTLLSDRDQLPGFNPTQRLHTARKIIRPKLTKGKAPTTGR